MVETSFLKIRWLDFNNRFLGWYWRHSSKNREPCNFWDTFGGFWLASHVRSWQNSYYYSSEQSQQLNYTLVNHQTCRCKWKTVCHEPSCFGYLRIGAYSSLKCVVYQRVPCWWLRHPFEKYHDEFILPSIFWGENNLTGMSMVLSKWIINPI